MAQMLSEVRAKKRRLFAKRILEKERKRKNKIETRKVTL